MVLYFINVFHLKTNSSITIDLGHVFAIYSNKMITAFENSTLQGKLYKTPSAITTHAAFITISIIINHFKIISILFAKHHQSISTNAEMPIAQKFHLPGCDTIVFLIPVIEY